MTRKVNSPVGLLRPSKTRSTLPNATVEMFLQVLVSKLTQQDAKEYASETRRGGGGNIYRMGLLLEAAHKVEEDVTPYLKRDEPEAMNALIVSILHNFHSTYPPIKNVLKQIGNWTEKGKLPSLVA